MNRVVIKGIIANDKQHPMGGPSAFPKIQTIKAVRRFADLGLKEAKYFVDQVTAGQGPFTFSTDATRREVASFLDGHADYEFLPGEAALAESAYATVVVYSASGKEVDRLEISKSWVGRTLGRELFGRSESPLGFLGRALEDAEAINAGRDPERLSEKVMRLLATMPGDPIDELVEAHERGELV